MPHKLQESDRIADHYLIGERIDDVKGSVARVYAAQDLKGERPEIAFKVLRHEYLDLSPTNTELQRRERYEAFNREAELLHLLRDDKRVMELYEVGYIKERSNKNPTQIETLSLTLDVKQFRQRQAEAIAKGWLPYLVLRRYPRVNSLQYLLTKKGRQVRLPLIEAIEYSLQLVDLLVKLHNMNIIYWDAKPAHAYWDGQQLTLIDWNVSYPLTPENMVRAGGGSATSLKELDLLIIGRKFIYPAFIGREFLGNALTSIGTPDGSKVKEMHAFFYQGEVSLQGYESKLDAPVRQFLTQVVQSNQFKTVDQLYETLQDCAMQLGWKFEGKLQFNEAKIECLKRKRKVVAHLRAVHQNLETALQEVRQLEREFPGEDTWYLAQKVRELFKASDVP
jgi:serine/threonine protein kinase